MYVFAFHFERYPAIRSVLAVDIVRFRPRACRSRSPCLPAFLFIYALFYFVFPGVGYSFRFHGGKIRCGRVSFLRFFFFFLPTVESFLTLWHRFVFCFLSSECLRWGFYLFCVFYGLSELVQSVLVLNLSFQFNIFTIIVQYTSKNILF